MNLKMCEISTDVDKLKVDLQATFMKYTTIKSWAYIIHDKDDTRPHYHIALHFGGASVDTKKVAEWFELGYTDKDGAEHTGEQFVERVKCKRWSGIVTYLIHGQDSQKHKYQYPLSEVHANFDVETEIANEKILGNFEQYSYAQQLQYVNSLPLSEKAQAFSKLRKLWELQCQILTLNTDRQIQVIFITGTGGTGKTYYAKKLLTSRGYDFCISSSSNDPFQDYMGQKAIILDDIRDWAFSFEDLLKILDNNTSSSVKSRFSNKVFNGEMIVITSSVPLVYWFKGKDNHGNFYNFSEKDLYQLYRRIGCYVIVTETEVTVYDEIDNYGKPQGVGQVFKNELADKKNETKPKVDYKSMFGKICENPTDGDEVFNAAEQTKIKIN
ncbi:MAG: replication protein [Roseburia sp.]|nr:replication protein [Roseburia sp.]